MVQAIIQGRINTKLEVKENVFVNGSEVSVVRFGVRCINTLGGTVSITCIAYGLMCNRIFKNYETSDYVTITGTFAVNKDGTKFTLIIFGIEPSYLVEARRRLSPLEDVAPEKDYTLEDIKEFLKYN